MSKISEGLEQLVLEAIELGYGCFGDGDHSPFVIILDNNANRQLIDFQNADENIDSDLLGSARETIRETFSSAKLYTLVWDGYLTTDGVKGDAVFAEAGEKGEADAFIFAQRYKQKKRAKSLEKIGDPEMGIITENLLK